MLSQDTTAAIIKPNYFNVMFLPCVECCGDGIIPVNPAVICCEGVRQRRPPNAECCGKRAYDSLRQICCGGQVINKKKYRGKYLAKLKKYLALFGITLTEYAEKHGLKLKSMLPCLECCGDKPYFERNDRICCDGKWQTKPPNAECCGEKAINSMKMICCEGVPQPRPPNAGCCGTRAYDRRREKCCSNATISTMAPTTAVQQTEPPTTAVQQTEPPTTAVQQTEPPTTAVQQTEPPTTTEVIETTSTTTKKPPPFTNRKLSFWNTHLQCSSILCQSTSKQNFTIHLRVRACACMWVRAHACIRSDLSMCV